MLLLEFLYALVQSTQKTEGRNAVRYAPYMCITAILFPLVRGFGMAAIQLLGLTVVAIQDSGFRNLDRASLFSLLIAMAIGLFCFDRRRSRIDAKFDFLPPIQSDIGRIGIALLLIGGGTALLKATFVNPVWTAVAFLFFLALGEVVLRRVVKKEASPT